MKSLRFFCILLMSPFASGLASLYLAYEGLVDQQSRSSTGILVAVAFIAIAGVINFMTERSLKQKIAKVNFKINGRLNSLIGSLGEISADGYHYWKVDVYVAHWRPRLTSDWPWALKETLVRRASASIVSTMSLHDNRTLLENGPIGLCFALQSQQVWLSPDLGVMPDPAIACSNIPSSINSQLKNECGLLRAVPITNHLDADCIGVLVAHVEPQFGLRLSGTILTDECARRLRTAAKDLHQMVRG